VVAQPHRLHPLDRGPVDPRTLTNRRGDPRGPRGPTDLRHGHLDHRLTVLPADRAHPDRLHRLDELTVHPLERADRHRHHRLTAVPTDLLDRDLMDLPGLVLVVLPSANPLRIGADVHGRLVLVDKLSRHCIHPSRPPRTVTANDARTVSWVPA